MELPLASQNARAGHDATSLVRAIKRADVILARTAATETALAGATAFVNPARPQVHMCNFAAELHLPPGLSAAEALLDIHAHFQQANATCSFLQCHDADWPAAWEQPLLDAGYQRAPEAAIMRLTQQPQPPRHPPAMVQIVPARAVLRDLPAFHAHIIRHTYHTDADVTAQLTATFMDHLDEPRLEPFVARVNGQMVAIAALINLGDIGVIDNVQTLAEHRSRGIATALLLHLLDHAARAQFTSVILETLPDTPAMRLYQTLGFVELRRFAKWTRESTK